jgi:hypothetical protein
MGAVPGAAVIGGSEVLTKFTLRGAPAGPSDKLSKLTGSMGFPERPLSTHGGHSPGSLRHPDREVILSLIRAEGEA